jgi:hypothetical protein
MHDSHLPACSAKGKKQNIRLLKTCFVAPDFWDEREISGVSLVSMVILGNSWHQKLRSGGRVTAHCEP